MDFFATILTRELVPQKNLFLRELPGQEWSLHHVRKSNNRGSVYQPGDGVELASVVLQKLCLPLGK